ncbi:hypothetical protein G4O51_05315 [Candidatus Bathyarchaeota archaeon A05DMB-2]|jgi:hypothetical protein|nr:hypothetical protein [Candidatus Bathyarchaeota archaeon A05DMB-2]
MKNKSLLGTLLITITIIGLITPLARADTLVKTDFEQESFAKTIDYFEYVRAYATLNGVPTPDNFDKWHANMYMTYVNSSGLKMLYAGLEEITTDESRYLRIPMQSFIMAYKTNENNRDVVLASTFLMLMAFNETSNTLYPDSPDRNDVLFASFSLGFDLSNLGATLPVLNSKTETIPLTHEGNQWTWGMKYTNLTALWWRTWINPNNPHFNNSWPLALTVYDELTFKYTLTIDPASGTATLQENHVIGRMRHLFVGVLPLLWTYYNSTGNYGMLGRKISNETIYDYIQNNGIEMSIINFQTSVMADHETYSQTPSGQNVTDTEVPVTDTSINTHADDGEKIFTADFGTKKSYNLYNYTADSTETQFETYDSTARTAKIAGYAGNAGLFAYHIGLMKFLPLVVVHMYPALFAKSLSTIANMSRADYFYIIAYPHYSGYRVVHDPTFTAYVAATQSSTPSTPNSGGAIIMVAAIIIIVVGLAVGVLLTRRKLKRQWLS